MPEPMGKNLLGNRILMVSKDQPTNNIFITNKKKNTYVYNGAPVLTIIAK